MNDGLTAGPIGVFDSGYGGLTVFKDIERALPHFDYIYLGDNARTPYGTRSLDTVYEFTLQGVEYLFAQGCHLVILACNTASANALRRIQQCDLTGYGQHKRVLGVIRPTTERMSELTTSGHLGLFATEATVNSDSYKVEAAKYAPKLIVHQQACPMWVPIIENDEQDTSAAEYFTQKYVNALLAQHDDIDAVLLACTHYPLIKQVILKHMPENIQVVAQGELVADSLVDYLERHQWMAEICSAAGQRRFLTTDSARDFEGRAARFLGRAVSAEQIAILGK